MDNHWRSILGKGHMVKVLLILVLGAFFQLIQVGTNLEGHTKQLRSEVHFGHEHKAQHTIVTEVEDESTSALDNQIPLSQENDLLIVSSDTLRAFGSENNEDNPGTLDREEEDDLSSDYTDELTSTSSDTLLDETETETANEQPDDDDDDEEEDYEDKDGDDDNEDEDGEEEESEDEYDEEEEGDEYGEDEDDDKEDEDGDEEESEDEYDEEDDYYQYDEYGGDDDESLPVAIFNTKETTSTSLANEAINDYAGTSLSNTAESGTENDALEGKLKLSEDLVLTVLWNETNSTDMRSTNKTGISVTSKSNSTKPSEAHDTKVTDALLLELKQQEEKQQALHQAAKEKFDTNRSFKNESTFNTVDREIYEHVVEKAQVSVKSVIEDVYTDCEIYILPSTVEVGKPSENPMVQFKCLDDSNATLRDDVCHKVNMCKVVLDEDAWGILPTDSTTGQDIKTKKSTLLMMVDSAETLMLADNFNSFINKASYAYRSDRPFYVWIGNPDEKELNRREVETLEPAFGFSCAVSTIQNSMGYYKPLAFLVLFEMLASSPQKSDSIFYLDADSSFNRAAFELIGDDELNGIGPESYFGLSPQASLVATTNENGRSLMNSGAMILRDTRWAREFSSLWWYGRCGSQDQLSLWLTLYATWSAWTEGQKQFAYPGEIFFDYATAKNKLFMHFRKYVHSLQASWEDIVELRQKEQNEDDYMFPVPKNTELYNGGSYSLGPKLSAPMELPHVVILPPAQPVSYQRIEVSPGDATAAFDVQKVDLLKLKGNSQSSLVKDSKDSNSCSEDRCWPYVQDLRR